MYPRECEECGKGIRAGYILDDGSYCSLECMDLTEQEWDDLYNDDNYYTEWED